MTKMMVTWLGEDEEHFEITTDPEGNEIKRPAPGPSFNYWGHVRFDKDKPTLIDTDAGKGSHEKLVLDQIALKAPKMLKRFKVEPVPDRQQERERQQSKG